jgi:hypothetical protein
MTLFARTATQAFAWASLASAMTAGALISLESSAHAYNPAVTVPTAAGNYYPGANPSSFGYFFDAKTPVLIDGIGFSSQPGWPGGSSQYTVTLWSFKNGGGSPLDYTEIVSKTFTPGVSYDFDTNYFWQSLPPIYLPGTYTNTDPNNLKGYVIAAIGNFSNAPGNVEYEGGVATVADRFVLGGNGFNDSSDLSGFYPIPIGDGGVGIDGYFNPNLSYVPGPLPIFGVASAFGMARRMRRRVNSAK